MVSKYSSCEFSNNDWDDQGLKTGIKIINRQIFKANDDDAQIIIYGDKGFMSTIKFKKNALVLLGEHTILCQTEDQTSVRDLSFQDLNCANPQHESG